MPKHIVAKRGTVNRRVLPNACAFVVALGSFLMAATSVAQTVTVIPPNGTVAGRTYGQWSAAWWQWDFSIPVPANPSFDTTGNHCHVSQSGPVFFLAGSATGAPITRDCSVSADKVLLFPLINVECSTLEPPPFFGSNETELRACAQLFMDGVPLSSLVATIDGNPIVTNLGLFRFQSPLYNFSVPGDNILGVHGGSSGSSVSDGYWLMIRLAEGNHVLHFEAEFVSPPSVAGFSQDVTHNLTVR